MKKSPPSFYAHKLISALGLAGGLLLCVATSHAADVTFDLNNTNDDSRFKLVGSAQFFTNGGVGDSRFIDLTDGTGQSCAVLFPDFEPGFVVASFTFECMIKCGDWFGNPPADGFSVNYVNASDPIVALIESGTDPGRGINGSGQWHGSQDQAGNEIDLPEEGTQTGIAVGFDTWGRGNDPVGGQNGDLDARGISVRVDGVFADFSSTFGGFTFPGQIAMPNVAFPDGDAHDFTNDATTLITGPFTCGDDTGFAPGFRGLDTCLISAGGTEQPGSKLAWVPLKVDVQEDGTINVFWKGVQIVTNVHTAFGPRPGRILFGASTGGAMEFVGIDNIHIVTRASTVAVIGRPTVLQDATGFTITVIDSGSSVVNVTPANTTLKLDGTVVTGWTSSKTGPTTTITYILPGGAHFASASTHPVDLATVDGNGTAITKSQPFTVFTYSTLDASIAAAGVDKTKPGFAVKVWQSFHGLASHNDHYDRVLHGESGQNVADLTQSGPDGNPLGADGSFAEPGAIDYAADAVSLGHFTEVQMPGFPSQILPDYKTDMAALEAFSYVDFPTAGFRTMYVRSDDGFRVLAGRNLHDRFQIDSLNMGEFDGGRGASDTTFKIYVKDPGTYAFRLIWQNQGGGANLEWGTVESDGSPHLLNGTFDTNGAPDSVALKAYRVGPTSKRAYISSIRPGVRSAPAGTGTPSIRSGIVLGEAGDPLVVTVVDGDTTHLVDGSGHLTVNSSDVTGSTTFNRVGATTTITWKPAGGLLFNTDYNCTLRYDEDTTPAGSLVTRTQSWNSFVWSEVMPLDLPTNSFWIEAEDFDFNRGQTMAAASTMPYTGDAYLNNGGAVFGIDYLNDDNQDSTLYRTNSPPSGDLSVAGKGVNIDRPTPFSRWGGTRPGPVTMTANYKIGWIGGPDWCNYTRTIPAGTYTAYSAQSYDGDGFGQLHGRLSLVTAGVGTANQTLQDLGFFDARGSGGWGMNDVVSMQNPVGRHAYFKLPGGQVTLRFFGDSGDFDWFILVPANNVTPQIVARTPAPGDTVAANTPIVIKVQDFTTTLNPATVNLTINGTDVSAGVVKNKVGDTTTLTYTPNPLLAPGASTYVISYADSLGTPTTLQVNFTVPPLISIGLVNGKPTITFTGTLLSSPTAGGTYSPVAGATSPYTVPGGGQTGFYRSTQ